MRSKDRKRRRKASERILEQPEEKEKKPATEHVGELRPQHPLWSLVVNLNRMLAVDEKLAGFCSPESTHALTEDLRTMAIKVVRDAGCIADICDCHEWETLADPIQDRGPARFERPPLERCPHCGWNLKRE
jgi:hypothetical protein